MRTIYKTTITSLLFILLLISVNANETKNIYNTTKCYEKMNVKVRVNGTPDYEVERYKQNDDLWYKKCNGQGQSIDVTVYDNKTYVFDFVIEYYIAPVIDVKINDTGKGPSSEEIQNQNNKRTIHLSNIVFNEKQDKKDVPFIWPEMSNGIFIIIIIIIIFVSFVFGLIFIFKWIYNDKEEKQINEASLRGINNTNEPTDEEVAEFIRNNT